MRRERKELPDAFFGDSQEEKDTVRTEGLTSEFTSECLWSTEC